MASTTTPPRDLSEGSHSPVPIPSSSQIDIAASSHQTSVSENVHLSYPTFDEPRQSSPPVLNQARSVLKDRLYVGNLHPSVDEYVALLSTYLDTVYQ